MLVFPPQLPPFLATMFDLKPIVGAPSAEEVKLVHVAIRAMSSYTHTPELRDSDLPIELQQHLFDVQMACYCEKYAVGIFPNDIVYTPPSLPAHIPVKLELVVGAPSDEEIRSVYTAIRVSDSLSTNIASLFDADLSMQLSQHVFDLQLARHIHRSTGVQARDRPALQHRNSTLASAQDLGMVRQPDERRGTDTEAMGRENQPPDVTPPATGPSNVPHTSTTQQGEPLLTHPYQEEGHSRECANSLTEIKETLKDVIKVLVASQNSLARGFNSCYYYEGGFNLGGHSLINEKGETPEMHGLPTVKGRYNCFTSEFAQNLSAKALAQYLQFYGIGNEIIEEGEEIGIKPGMENDAKRLLTERVGIRLN